MRRSFIWLLLLTGLVWLVLGLSGATSGASAAGEPAGTDRYVPGRILVGYRAEASAKGRTAVRAVGGTVADSISNLWPRRSPRAATPAALVDQTHKYGSVRL